LGHYLRLHPAIAAISISAHLPATTDAMPQLHCYVSEDVADSLKRRAEQAGMSVSRYLAELAKRDVGQTWPEGYFEQVFGCEKIDPIRRADQGEFEQRTALDE
jgi:hypothetical protein